MTRLAAANLSKSYAGVRVLAGVDFDVGAGEVHALVGENGAGKSTLVKILAGAVVPDSGSVALDGHPLPIGDPAAVRRSGVSVVYQELALVPELTVAENVFLGRERAPGVVPVLQRGAMNRATQSVLDELGVRVAATAAVRGLSVAHQQMVEIARALVSDARVMILDEPTATLSHVEIDRLFGVLRRLRARGLGVIYISHRLEEIFALAHRVTVLRDGKCVASTPAAALDRPTLIRAMVGRDVSEEFPSRRPPSGAVVLDVRGLASPPRFSDVSLAVREGEIVGVAGLVGAGRTSAALAIAGALPSTGDVRLKGRPVHFASPAEAIGHGVVYVTEDRKARGIFPSMGVGANMTITYLSMFTRGGALSLARERRAAEAAARDYDVRAASLSQPIATLSGGNQQKALLARYMLKCPSVVVLDEPTRGVDVGARGEIYALMNRLTADGLAVVMISSDLPEVLGMADRIVVIREGRTAGELSRADATAERVMALATAS